VGISLGSNVADVFNPVSIIKCGELDRVNANQCVKPIEMSHYKSLMKKKIMK
jgi:hypothetical protein